MKKFLCFIGLHDWKYTQSKDDKQIALDLDLPNVRQCNICKTVHHVTLLGINMYTGESIEVWSKSND